MIANTPDTHHITRLLGEIAEGKTTARDELVSAVYQQLRKIAQVRMNAERPGHTLQATELVNEACIQMLPGLPGRSFHNRSEFYGAAAEAMRRVLIGHARKRLTQKRGGCAVVRLESDAIGNVAQLADSDDPHAIIALNEAFEQLERAHPDRAAVVKLRFFAGLSVEETAEALGVSLPTVKRRWRTARALLYDALERDVESGAIR